MPSTQIPYGAILKGTISTCNYSKARIVILPQSRNLWHTTCTLPFLRQVVQVEWSHAYEDNLQPNISGDSLLAGWRKDDITSQQLHAGITRK